MESMHLTLCSAVSWIVVLSTSSVILTSGGSTISKALSENAASATYEGRNLPETYGQLWKRMCRPKCKGGLGFRDFDLFNKALLGKQSWRLLVEDDSLMFRVLKGKYFPDRGFAEAELGCQPSYTWRGLWEAREVVLRGARKRIGDGNHTRVWLDPWIPKTQTKRVISPRGSSETDMRVSELMLSAVNAWDTSKVESLFLPFERQRILSINLSESRPRDEWCWDAEKNGLYSVRSAYKLLADDDKAMPGQSNDKADMWLWNGVWQVPVIPRIKLFFWQLCQNALATKGNLATRLDLTDNFCPRCRVNVETCLHVVRDCGWVGEVWDGLGSDVQSCAEGRGIRDWVEAVFRETGEEGRAEFMTCCYAIWERRNKAVFEDDMWRAEWVIKRTLDLLSEMSKVREAEDRGKGQGQQVEGGRAADYGAVGMSERRKEAAVKWVRPGTGVKKINVDAGRMPDAGVGCGFVCRDDKGVIEWAGVVQSAVDWDPTFAEAMAILHGIKAAQKEGVRDVIVESDCLPVVNSIKAGTLDRSDIALVYRDIKEASLSFVSISFQFVRRKSNNVAHTLAHFTPWHVGQRFWRDDIPRDIVLLGEKDLMNGD